MGVRRTIDFGGVLAKRRQTRHARRALLLAATSVWLVGIADLSSARSSVGQIGRTTKTLASGNCATMGCHAGTPQDANVTIGGVPTSMSPGTSAIFTVTATKAGLVGARVGVDIAASDTTPQLTVNASNLVVSSGEVVHTTAGGTALLNTSDANGSASYSFTYTMPANALGGTTHTLYASARIGFGGSWGNAAN